MTEEAYCNPEIAELLKEKGMDKECFTHYIQKNNSDGTSEAVTTCTQQSAMRWLREKHYILIFTLPANIEGNLAYLCEVWTWNEEEGIYESTYAPMPRYIYEDAVEAAIQYSLKNLI